MTSDFRLSEGAQTLWRCPICKFDLFRADIEVVCTNDACRSRFPIVAGVPVLLNESSSLFSIRDLSDQALTTASASARLRSAVIRRFPSNSRNHVAAKNYKQ